MELCDARSATLLGDKGYDSDEIRADLAKRGIKPVRAKA
jgi:IS5 family transposase